ncbi:MAG: phosphoribosylglycinamide formyltransferase [Bacteroidales bacterium]|jgi:phosphoribosylglycinamide formyltransferase-1|nr:phosphoribosylglycinamide formyltransferase [Bacteroidales bacterium]
MKQIVIFASGSGSNAQQITEYLLKKGTARVVRIYSNRADAYVLERAKELNIPTRVFGKEEFDYSDVILNELKEITPDLIVLAGFLWKIPEKIVRAFPGKIINIHPALLPKYGGKGMYGDKVHQSVIENKEKKSGITIHYVNENYDEGAVILQAECPVTDEDTPETLAKKVHTLEYKYYPETVEKLLLKK